MFRKLMAAVDLDQGRGEFLKCVGGLKEFGAREAVVAFCADVPDIAGRGTEERSGDPGGRVGCLVRDRAGDRC